MGESRSKARSVRADREAWEVLEWWSSLLGVPLGTLLRAAIEDCADDVIRVFVNDVDEDMPDDALLKRVRHRINPGGSTL